MIGMEDCGPSRARPHTEALPKLLHQIDRANVLEQATLNQVCDADLPAEARELAERNHQSAAETRQELHTMLARHTLLA